MIRHSPRIHIYISQAFGVTNPALQIQMTGKMTGISPVVYAIAHTRARNCSYTEYVRTLYSRRKHVLIVYTCT